MTQLSPNFSLLEATKSQVALRHGINNEPNGEEIAAMKALAVNVLEPVRAHFGKPFTPSSWFRNDRVNKLAGGVYGSQHTKGEAADFEIPGVSNYDLANWIKNNLKFDQLILEFYTRGHTNSGWVHCSYRQGNNRSEALTYTTDGQRLRGLCL